MSALTATKSRNKRGAGGISAVRLQAQVSPRTVNFWGTEYKITPLLVEEIFGDGKQLIWLEPLATRPNYYVVRVDSKWDIDNGGRDPLCDHLDDIYEAIENEYGDSDRGEGGWPALSTSCGMRWGNFED